MISETKNVPNNHFENRTSLRGSCTGGEGCRLINNVSSTNRHQYKSMSLCICMRCEFLPLNFFHSHAHSTI